ncbi:hypothetical protein [Brevundimonas sp. TWP2-3-4b2]|uniref:hypothetical protein n=1 Tax=Brevundimonas sp. TWP2-3-4b2 TaxID=2804595 RepID=UPI003CF5267C
MILRSSEKAGKRGREQYEEASNFSGDLARNVDADGAAMDNALANPVKKRPAQLTWASRTAVMMSQVLQVEARAASSMLSKAANMKKGRPSGRPSIRQT